MVASKLGKTAAIGGALAAVAACLWAFFVEPKRLTVEDVVVPCPGLSGPVRILLFSDVDFPSEAGREQRVLAVARAFRPDLVLVAGDLLDRPATVSDPAVRERAGAWVGAMPASAGRYLAMGEDETWLQPELQETLARHDVRALANTGEVVEVRGDRLALLVADPRRQPAPFALVREGSRTFLHCQGRPLPHRLTSRAAGVLEALDLDLSFAFRLDDARSEVTVELAGWTLSRGERHPRFHFGSAEAGVVPAAGVWYRARLRVADEGDATRLRARFWREGREEPATWDIDVRETHPARPRDGPLTLGGMSLGKAFDDLRLVSGGRVSLEDGFDAFARLTAEWDDPSPIAAWMRTPAPSTVRLVLAHTPDVVYDLDASGGPPPCLVLSGHTHGGQVRLPLVGPLHTGTRLPRRFAQGLNRFRDIPVYVTRGVGTSVIHARFLAPPEVTRVTLVPPDGRATRP